MTADPETLQAVAHLTAAGKSTREIAPIVGVSHATVNNYQHLDEVRQVINDLRPRIAARLSQRMWDLIDAEDFAPKPQELAVVWGIAMDKHMKAEQPTQGNPTLVIVLPGLDRAPDPQPLTIDAGPQA